MEANGDPRVVLVHDWLTGMRGGEKCLEVLCRRWPRRPLFTLLHRPGSVVRAIERLRPAHQLPAAPAGRPPLLPLSAAADAAGRGSWRLPRVRPGRQLQPLRRQGGAAAARRAARLLLLHADALRLAHARRLLRPGSARGAQGPPGRVSCWHALRSWDRRTAARVTHFVAISRTVQQRIAECYGRRQHRHLSAGRHRFLLPGRRCRARITTWSCRPSRRTSGSTWPSRRATGWAGSWSSSAPGQDERRLAAPGRADRALPRLAARRGHPRSPAPLPGAALSRRGGFRHRAGRGAGVRHAGDRLRPRRRHRNRRSLGTGAASRPACGSKSKPSNAWRPPSRRSSENQRHFAPATARRQSLRFTQGRFTHELFAFLDSVLYRRQTHG